MSNRVMYSPFSGPQQAGEALAEFSDLVCDRIEELQANQNGSFLDLRKEEISIPIATAMMLIDLSTLGEVKELN